MKTSKLTGAALDWAVAECEGLKTADLLADGIVWLIDSQGYISRNFNPSSNWTWGGPIIERERINVGDNCPTGWQASKRKGVLAITSQGPTPLIAAMRCYVASKLGDNVEIPDQLKA